MDLSPEESIVGEITAIKPYGAFVRLSTGDQGMIHISEIAVEYVRDISQYLTVGQQVVVKVIGRNEEGKYNLSLKRVSRHDHDAALFHNEVTQVKRALDEGLAVIDESVKQFITRRERRPAQESLTTWLTSIKREKNELERHRQWRARFYEPDWQQLAESTAAPNAPLSSPSPRSVLIKTLTEEDAASKRFAPSPLPSEGEKSTEVRGEGEENLEQSS